MFILFWISNFVFYKRIRQIGKYFSTTLHFKRSFKNSNFVKKVKSKLILLNICVIKQNINTHIYIYINILKYKSNKQTKQVNE